MKPNINKIPLRDFHEPIVQPFDEVLKADNDHDELALTKAEEEAKKTSEAKAEVEAEAASARDVHFAITQEILEQNRHMESILMQIRDSLAAIESQQQESLITLSKKMLEYVSLVSRKLFGSSNFSKVFTDIVQSRISNIIDNLSTKSLITIKLPKVEGNLKENIINTIKNTAGKLNIEVIEHEHSVQKVEVGWDSGKAEFDVEQTVAIVEKQAHKLDTTS